MTRMFRKIADLSLTDHRVLLAAMFWLPVMRARLFMSGFAATHRSVTEVPMGVSQGSEFARMVRIAAMVGCAGRYSLGRSTCLTRSLVLLRLLRRRGRDARLRIGVRIRSGGLEAHAWVEYDGMPVNDRKGIGDDFLPFAQVIPLSAFVR